VLIATSAASILSTDLYTPSMPHLPDYFGTDAASVQLTLSLNVLGFGLAQVVHGPLSDRFGRRPVLLLGIAAFTVLSLACAGEFSISALIAARLLEGAAAAVEAVVILAIIRDLYDEKQSAKLLAVYGMVVALAPAIGPVIGGHVHIWLGWRANFLLLTGFAAIVLVLLWRFLPESTVPDRTALQPRVLARGYWTLVRSRTFLAYTLVLGFLLGALFAFITAGPFIMIDRLGVATEDFGYYQAVIVLAFFLGSLGAARAVDRAGLEPTFRLGLGICALGGVAFIAVLGAALKSARSPERSASSRSASASRSPPGRCVR